MKSSDNAPMAAIEFVDRPGEIRAARPPKSRILDSLDTILEDVGIKSIRKQGVNVWAEKGSARLFLKS